MVFFVLLYNQFCPCVLFDLNPNRYYTAHSFINFLPSCFQSVLSFLLASFCSLVLDIVRYARGKTNENLLNIKQKYIPKLNSTFVLRLSHLINILPDGFLLLNVLSFVFPRAEIYYVKRM